MKTTFENSLSDKLKVFDMKYEKLRYELICSLNQNPNHPGSAMQLYRPMRPSYGSGYVSMEDRLDTFDHIREAPLALASHIHSRQDPYQARQLMTNKQLSKSGKYK